MSNAHKDWQEVVELEQENKGLKELTALYAVRIERLKAHVKELEVALQTFLTMEFMGEFTEGGIGAYDFKSIAEEALKVQLEQKADK